MLCSRFIQYSWETGAWSQDTYDASLVGKNSPGVMGMYHPVIYIMSLKEFETLKGDITSENILEWNFLYILIILLFFGLYRYLILIKKIFYYSILQRSPCSCNNNTKRKNL